MTRNKIRYCTDRTCGGTDCASCYPFGDSEIDDDLDEECDDEDDEDKPCGECGFVSCHCPDYDEIERFKEEREEMRWMERMDRKY